MSTIAPNKSRHHAQPGLQLRLPLVLDAQILPTDAPVLCAGIQLRLDLILDEFASASDLELEDALVLETSA